MEAWQPRIAQGPLRQPDKLPQAIGRLQERDPRVARSDRMADDARQQSVSWQEETAQTAGAAPLEGRDVLKTDRHALTADESGRTSIGLTRGEAALRAMQSPLRARPIFHHVQQRTETHLFLGVLASHLLVAMEKRFVDTGMHTAWGTLRHQRSTHQGVPVVLPTRHGQTVKMRQGTTPEPTHGEISQTLHLPREVMKPVKTWHEPVTS